MKSPEFSKIELIHKVIGSKHYEKLIEELAKLIYKELSQPLKILNNDQLTLTKGIGS